jgi:integrase
MGKSLRNLASEAERRLDDFDAAEARALKPGEWLTFTGHSGLRLHRSGGTRTFAYRYVSPVDGRLRQIKIGNGPAVPWAKAVARWDDHRRLRDEGIDPQLERRRKRSEAQATHRTERAAGKRDAVTVERVFLAEHIAKECRTEKAKYDALRMFEGRVLPEIGERPAVAIDRGDAADFLARVKLDATAMARLLRSRLGGAWDHAIARRLLPANHVNPWRDPLRGKLKGKARSRFLDDRELAVLLASMSGLPPLLAKRRISDGEDIGDALLFTLYTATRSGEVAAMDWDAVDLARGTWTLADTKTDTPRTIQLPRQALAILKARGRGFAVQQQRLSLGLREAKHFRLRAFTPHDLCRSARTGLSRLGVRDEVAEAALGHVKGGIRGTYDLHRFEAEVGEALQKWCDHLDALHAPGVLPIRRSA